MRSLRISRIHPGECQSGQGAIHRRQRRLPRAGRLGSGKTSPEELIAAAQATCYAMALSNTLNTRGTPPERLTVNAVCTLDRVAGGVKISGMRIDARGKVPGLDQAGFEEAARQAERGCPVANALRNNVDISLTARLE